MAESEDPPIEVHEGDEQRADAAAAREPAALDGADDSTPRRDGDRRSEIDLGGGPIDLLAGVLLRELGRPATAREREIALEWGRLEVRKREPLERFLRTGDLEVLDELAPLLDRCAELLLELEVGKR